MMIVPGEAARAMTRRAIREQADEWAVMLAIDGDACMMDGHCSVVGWSWSGVRERGLEVREAQLVLARTAALFVVGLARAE